MGAPKPPDADTAVAGATREVQGFRVGVLNLWVHGAFGLLIQESRNVAGANGPDFQGVQS